MSLTVKKVCESKAVLFNIIERDAKSSLSIPFSGRLKLALNSKKVGPVYDEFVKQNNELITKFGTDAGDGKFAVTADNPRRSEFNKEFLAMLESDSGIEKLLVFAEKDLDGSLLSAEDLKNLINLELLEIKE